MLWHVRVDGAQKSAVQVQDGPGGATTRNLDVDRVLSQYDLCEKLSAWCLTSDKINQLAIGTEATAFTRRGTLLPPPNGTAESVILLAVSNTPAPVNAEQDDDNDALAKTAVVIDNNKMSNASILSF